MLRLLGQRTGSEGTREHIPPTRWSVRHLTCMISSSLRNTQREKTPVSPPQRQKRQLRPAAPCLGPQQALLRRPPPETAHTPLHSNMQGWSRDDPHFTDSVTDPEGLSFLPKFTPEVNGNQG